jgi:hypothetical protein
MRVGERAERSVTLATPAARVPGAVRLLFTCSGPLLHLASLPSSSTVGPNGLPLSTPI